MKGIIKCELNSVDCSLSTINGRLRKSSKAALSGEIG